MSDQTHKEANQRHKASGHAHGAESFWSKYVFSTDHKIIGMQYFFTGMIMALKKYCIPMIL